MPAEGIAVVACRGGGGGEGGAREAAGGRGRWARRLRGQERVRGGGAQRRQHAWHGAGCACKTQHRRFTADLMPLATMP